MSYTVDLDPPGVTNWNYGKTSMKIRSSSTIDILFDESMTSCVRTFSPANLGNTVTFLDTTYEKDRARISPSGSWSFDFDYDELYLTNLTCKDYAGNSYTNGSTITYTKDDTAPGDPTISPTGAYINNTTKNQNIVITFNETMDIAQTNPSIQVNGSASGFTYSWNSPVDSVTEGGGMFLSVWQIFFCTLVFFKLCYHNFCI